MRSINEIMLTTYFFFNIERKLETYCCTYNNIQITVINVAAIF
jgi:hypothetical protein